MNELELAERFNRELDGVFREGKSAAFGPDPAAMELAASLARADYSGESEIRESLRAKLVTLSLAAGGSAGDAALPAGPSKLFGWLPRDVFARAALAAACLLLVLIPILRRSGGTGKESVTAPAQLPAQRFEGRAAVTASSAVQRKAAVLVQARARAASTAAAPGVFNSIPMARPEMIRYQPLTTGCRSKKVFG